MHTSFTASLRRARFALVWIALLTAAAPASAQGLLAPPGPPAPTMKSLQEISDQIVALPVESRTALNSPNALVSITQPGSYYLTGKVRSLVITSSNVTLDLNGYTVSPPADINAITVSGFPVAVRNVTVRNGRIVGPGTTTPGAQIWEVTYSGNNGLGVFLGGDVQGVTLENLALSGFSLGISAYSDSVTASGGSSSTLRNLTVRNCARAITAASALLENILVYDCSERAVTAQHATLRNVRFERCFIGVQGSFLTLFEVAGRDLVSEGVLLSDSTVSGLSITRAGIGASGERCTFTRVLNSQNRGNGLVGANNIVHESVARGNAGIGFSGDNSRYQNVTASGNQSHGISGTGLSIDGAVVTSNAVHGVVAPESTVRGVSARNNTGAGVYADNSSIVACIARSNGDDGIRGLGSVISDSRAFGNDTNVGGYVAQSIVWNGGRITNSLADTASPAIP